MHTTASTIATVPTISFTLIERVKGLGLAILEPSDQC
jgi:hypothetical protein